MNAAGTALAWCAVQIALVGAASVGAYWLVVKLHQAAGGFAATTSLAVVFCLSAAAASPWPRWSFLEERPAHDDDDAKGRRSKIPLVGALTKAFGGSSQPSAPRGGAGSGVAAQALVRPWEANAEERPRFARTLLRGMHGAFWLDQRPRPDRWRWTGSLAVMFAVGLAWGAIRLAAALSAAAAIRRRSLPVYDGGMRELLASLQTQLGSTRPIELREVAWLSAPATLGWLRAVILLPADWRAWTEDERRAVLAHEVAHVERGDYLMWLAAQMALVLHFYHPAVHWLAARIRLEQEFAADAIAASVSGGRRTYVTALARLALRTPGAKRAAPFAAAAPSFVSNRGMLLQRIERLRGPAPDSPSVGGWMSKLVAAAILLTAAATASGFRGDNVWRPTKTAPRPSPAFAQAPAPVEKSTTSRGGMDRSS